MQNGSKPINVKELSKTVSYPEIHEALVMKSTCTMCATTLPFKDLLLLSCKCTLCKSCATKSVKDGTLFSKNAGNGSYTTLECLKHNKPLDIRELKGFMDVEIKNGSVYALKNILKMCKFATFMYHRQKTMWCRNQNVLIL